MLNQNRQIGWLALMMILLAMIACTLPVNQGDLTVNDRPIVFDLRGEVDHTWEAQLTPSQKYEVVVRNLDTIHPINQIMIVVSGDDLVNIAEPIVYRDNTATTSFEAPVDGQVRIVVISLIGELQEELGKHEVLIQSSR